MERIAEVLINRPSKRLDRPFTYRLPAELSELTSGWRCAVPFRGKTEEGIILSVQNGNGDARSYKLKDILAPVDTFAWFTPQMMQLARWIASYYMCTYIEALRLFLIDKKGIRTNVQYEIIWEAIPAAHPLHGLIDHSIRKLSAEDVDILWDDEVRQNHIEQGFLKEKEITRAVYQPPVEKWLIPTLDLSNVKLEKQHVRQVELMTYLLAHGSQPVYRLRKEGFSQSVIQTFCKNKWGYVCFQNKATFSMIQKAQTVVEQRELTEAQRLAYTKICTAIDAGMYCGQLLMGVTGSGKTEVYLRAAEHAWQQGGEVLVLVPEIALTFQMVDYFASRFGENVTFVHSKLSKGERYNSRMRVQNKESRIVIGSRSALFMPFQNLKLIIVDEEYDTSYKQDETPRYNGRDAAKELAYIHQCPIVLGAATPSVVTYAAYAQGKIELIEMKERVHQVPLPQVHIADMRREDPATMYSHALIDELSATARAGNKSILFLNRRGYATSLQCRDCGYVFKCPNCDVSLVYHKSRNQLQCHYCEYVFPVPERCPNCGGIHIAYTGQGTEKTEEQIKEILPEISCRRLDLDSTSQKYSTSQILKSFREGQFNVLLGTQMVTKGHDIPGVQLVGILSADSILNMPTYLASEEGFILITQCAGRAGRGEEQGQVILQTYNPSHYVIQAAKQQNYKEFYDKEITFRRALSYPPFVRMMKITCFSKNYVEAKKNARNIYSSLIKAAAGSSQKIFITPPYDEPIRKVRNIYYISIMIKGKSLLDLKTAIRTMPFFYQNGILIDVDPLS